MILIDIYNQQYFVLCFQYASDKCNAIAIAAVIRLHPTE